MPPSRFPDSGRTVPVFIDRLTSKLRLAPVRATDADYQSELRRQLVRLAVTERIKTLQREEREPDTRLQVRQTDAEQPSPRPGPPPERA